MAGVHLLQQLVTRVSGGFVLAFHEISAQRLADFVEAMRPAQPVPLSTLVDRSKQRKRTAGLFAITVDDGIAESAKSLAELCTARGWPATFYLPTHYIDSGDSMVFQWWRRIKPFLPRKKLHLRSTVIDLTPPGALDALSRSMERIWHSRRLESYLPVTMELAEIVAREEGIAMSAMQPAAPLTWTEVETLSKDPLIRFESHGVSHAAMSSLTEAELMFEMRHSRDVVAEHTGRPCRHLAYAFGNPTSIGNRAPVIARQFYDSACTMTLGPVDFADPWLLPRIPLYPENSIILGRLKILLKCNGISSRTTPRAAA